MAIVFLLSLCLIAPLPLVPCSVASCIVNLFSSGNVARLTKSRSINDTSLLLFPFLVTRTVCHQQRQTGESSFAPTPYSDILMHQRRAFSSVLNPHASLHLETPYWQFRMLCIWSLTKLLWITLAKITVFLHILYNYLRTCHLSSPKFELLKIVLPGRWKKVSKTW